MGQLCSWMVVQLDSCGWDSCGWDSCGWDNCGWDNCVVG